MSKNKYSGTINDLVCEKNAARPAQAAQTLARMASLAELENLSNPSPWMPDAPAIGAESTWMIVRLICTEMGVDYENVRVEARQNARREYADIERAAREIDEHDRFATPDENKMRSANALIELVEDPKNADILG